MSSLTESALLSVEDAVLLDFSVKLQLFDTFVLGQEAARADKVFQVFLGYTMLELQTLNLRLDDWEVSNDSTHAFWSVQKENETILENFSRF